MAGGVCIPIGAGDHGYVAVTILADVLNVVCGGTNNCGHTVINHALPVLEDEKVANFGLRKVGKWPWFALGAFNVPGKSDVSAAIVQPTGSGQMADQIDRKS